METRLMTGWQTPSSRYITVDFYYSSPWQSRRSVSRHISQRMFAVDGLTYAYGLPSPCYGTQSIGEWQACRCDTDSTTDIATRISMAIATLLLWNLFKGRLNLLLQIQRTLQSALLLWLQQTLPGFYSHCTTTSFITGATVAQVINQNGRQFDFSVLLPTS